MKAHPRQLRFVQKLSAVVGESSSFCEGQDGRSKHTFRSDRESPWVDGQSKPQYSSSSRLLFSVSTINGLSKIDLLEPHGWAPVYTDSAAVTHWRRPGKCAPGTSATTGYGEGDSSSALQAMPTCSSLSMAIRSSQPSCCLTYGGDFVAAARALAERDFGKQIERRGALRIEHVKPVARELLTAGELAQALKVSKAVVRALAAPGGALRSHRQASPVRARRSHRMASAASHGETGCTTRQGIPGESGGRVNMNTT